MAEAMGAREYHRHVEHFQADGARVVLVIGRDHGRCRYDVGRNALRMRECRSETPKKRKLGVR